jgi:kynurenine formamidase
MKVKTIGLALGTALGLASFSVAAQTWKVPDPSVRCPSKWGAADERGSMNHQNAAAVINATRMIKTGEVIELAHVLNANMPFFGTRRFDVHTKRTFMNQPSNRRGSNEEIVISEIGQVGTQFDGFAHQTHENLWYNCHKVDENTTRGGFGKFGIEKVGTIMTRGVMIDVAALKGVETLPDAYEITVQDLQQALARQGTTLRPGDAVLINTGWNKLWGKENARYVKTCPGLGIAAAEWLIRQDPMLLGADNWPVEVSPNPDPQLSLPVHQIALVVHGVHLLENMKLDEARRSRRSRFASAYCIVPAQAGTEAFIFFVPAQAGTHG